MELESLFFLSINSYAFAMVHLEVLQHNCAWTNELLCFIIMYQIIIVFKGPGGVGFIQTKPK